MKDVILAVRFVKCVFLVIVSARNYLRTPKFVNLNGLEHFSAEGLVLRWANPDVSAGIAFYGAPGSEVDMHDGAAGAAKRSEHVVRLDISPRRRFEIKGPLAPAEDCEFSVWIVGQYIFAAEMRHPVVMLVAQRQCQIDMNSVADDGDFDSILGLNEIAINRNAT